MHRRSLFWSYKKQLIGGVLPLALFAGGHNHFVSQLARRRGAAVVVLRFRTATDVCAQRCAARRNHEGGLDARNPAQCARVVNMLSGKFREVATGEGFDRVIAAEDAAAAVEVLRPLLPRADSMRVRCS